MKASQDLAQLIPNSRLQIFHRCGHRVQIERTRDFLTMVEDFLGENGALTQAGV